jgi:hypothetical protein
LHNLCVGQRSNRRRLSRAKGRETRGNPAHARTV